MSLRCNRVDNRLQGRKTTYLLKLAFNIPTEINKSKAPTKEGTKMVECLAAGR